MPTQLADPTLDFTTGPDGFRLRLIGGDHVHADSGWQTSPAAAFDGLGTQAIPFLTARADRFAHPLPDADH